MLGSSPLARGLRQGPHATVPRSWIIPARAGFTRRSSRTGARWPDHPRSRGVYSSPRKVFRAWVGSSPLARGLPDRQFVQHVVEGIIPARAGFTTGGRTSWTSRTDHPRSRGVYSRFAFRFRVFVGSSPLARGLLRVGGGMGGRRGIIPARAGFTAAGCPRRGPSPDHPRSRGVYVRPAARPVAWAGSSPLARGLRPPPRTRTRPARIIPARAGFTLRRARRRRLRRDHPRSRGVYKTHDSPHRNSPGSSPLARGLPPRIEDERGRGGIIPARAGFT